MAKYFRNKHKETGTLDRDDDHPSVVRMIGYKFLGVREFPSVDNPIISVNVTYPGANAEVIMNQITEPLEQNINGTSRPFVR